MKNEKLHALLAINNNAPRMFWHMHAWSTRMCQSNAIKSGPARGEKPKRNLLCNGPTASTLRCTLHSLSAKDSGRKKFKFQKSGSGDDAAEGRLKL